MWNDGKQCKNIAPGLAFFITLSLTWYGFNKLILDWDARNASGISELVDGYRKIIEAESIEDITKLLTDKETVYDYYNFIDFYSDTGYNDPETYLVFVDTPSLLLTDSAEYSNRTEYGDMY